MNSSSEPDFSSQIEQDLEKSQQALSEVSKQSKSLEVAAGKDYMAVAKDVVLRFKPVPEVYWRVINYSIGRSGSTKNPPEGMLFGLKKLILAIAKDPALGGGAIPASTVSSALKALSGDIIAATFLIHSVSRRLKTFEMQPIWGPILDDAMIRANLGFYIGAVCSDFGPGRAMLAGFAGRIGLAVLIATGTESQAEASITKLATGSDIRAVALEIYKADPLLVSAMILSASGCGLDSVLGVSGFIADNQETRERLNIHQKRWLATLQVTEQARVASLDGIEEQIWSWIEYEDQAERKELQDVVQNLKKNGHPWRWMM